MSSSTNECGLSKGLIFLFTVLLKACTSICSKVIMSMSGSENDKELFQKPLFITFGNCVGMSLALVMHVFVVYFRIPFPGYDHLSTTTIDSECSDEDDYCRPPLMQQQMVDHDSINSTYQPLNDFVRLGPRIPTQSDGTVGDTSVLINESGSLPARTASLTPLGDADGSTTKLPLSMYFIIAIPALLDLGGMVFSTAGLVYLDVSIFQMISNSQIVFVAMMKHYVLKNLLHKFHWVGVFWIVVSVFIGGISALLESHMSGNVTDGSGVTAIGTLVGVALVMAGTALLAGEIVIAEKLMSLDVPVPPLLLLGMLGLWGVVLSIFVMFPVGYFLPGNDHGSYENPFNAWSMLMNSRNLQLAFFIYNVGTFGYCVGGILVILQLGSIWDSISTNFSIVIIWVLDLFIFYYINPTFGEEWTKFSYLQIAGIAVLLYGTAIYNGSLLLEGQLLWAFGINCSEEYSTIKREQEQTGAEVVEDTIEEPLLTTGNEGGVV